MAFKNFAQAMNITPSVPGNKQSKEEVAQPEKTQRSSGGKLSPDRIKKASGGKLPCAGGGNVDDEKARIRKLIRGGAKLVESKFCYGCLDFSVDFPNTEKQKCYCRRVISNKEVLWKVISDDVLVGQCQKIEGGVFKN